MIIVVIKKIQFETSPSTTTPFRLHNNSNNNIIIIFKIHASTSVVGHILYDTVTLYEHAKGIHVVLIIV